MDVLAQLASALKERYAVDREIGRGGMATVYLARDVRHNRKVALKVLNPELGAVLGVERFLSEIQVTANLQHPNLLPLFDSGEAEGLLFYVMPYIEGESLRAQLLREKQLPIDDALHIAGAIASALDYAHRHGVIHRDLKPENILMHDGQPLVADFGIALAVSNAGGNRITQTGLSLGTPQYMSPEQATGDREIDGRTDVYSLGAMTYEMLVGEPPHDGKTSQAIIAKVITDKPRSIRLTRDAVTRQLEAAVEKALAKLPADRFHTAREFADALTGKVMTGHFVSGATPVAAAARGPRAWRDRARGVAPWAAAVVAMIAAGSGWGVALRTKPAASVLRYEVPVPANTTMPTARGNTVAISPDGRFVAFAAQSPNGSQRIYLRAADELQPREVPGSESAMYPFFSPEGGWLGFWTGGQFMKAPLSGGAPDVIADAPVPSTVTWTPSGWIVGSAGSRLVKSPATGGAPVPFTRADTAKGEISQTNPVALRDGETVLYSSIGRGGSPTTRIGVASLTDGSSTILDIEGMFPLGVLDGHVVYTTAAGTLMAAPFDLGARRVTGPPIALGDQSAVNAANNRSFAQMSLDGSLVYVSGVARRQLALVGADGASVLVGEAGPISWPRFSPDGKRIAVSIGSLSQRDVWVVDLAASSSTRLTAGGGISDRPEWSPDGKSVVFRSNRRQLNTIWSQPLDGNPASYLFGMPAAEIDEGVLSADGRYLVVQRDSTGSGEVWYRAMQGDTTPRFVEGGAGAYAGRFSPDGRWLAYAAGDGANTQVFVRAFPSLATRYQVTLAGGTTPVWSADSKRIYYANGGQLLVATIGSTQPFTIASRAVVLARGYTFNNVHADFDVARDGRIVALQSPSQDQQLVVVRNLGTELRARLRGTPR
jgi:Tol biopolymer transport system component